MLNSELYHLWLRAIGPCHFWAGSENSTPPSGVGERKRSTCANYEV